LKSRALWLKAGNNNTTYIHQFTNFRKNTNTIWDIKNAEGRIVSSFQEKEEAGVSYFENLFQAPTGCPIHDILEVVSKFPAVFSKESNQALEGEVT